MNIKKLNWAGLQLDCGDKTLLIDAVENFTGYYPVLGHPLTPLIYFSDDVKADYILVTHLHRDHFDPAVLAKCLKPGGKVFISKKPEQQVRALSPEFSFLETDELFSDGAITIKAVYSLDGIGEEQTAWIVSYKDITIFHGGDTIWHNQFWKTGKENPGIDFAFLPINGVVVNFEMIGLQFSTVPASMTPEQAFNAAKLLRAAYLIPIHYGKFASALYQPCDTSEQVLQAYSTLLEQPFQLLNDGDMLR